MFWLDSVAAAAKDFVLASIIRGSQIRKGLISAPRKVGPISMIGPAHIGFTIQRLLPLAAGSGHTQSGKRH